MCSTTEHAGAGADTAEGERAWSPAVPMPPAKLVLAGRPAPVAPPRLPQKRSPIDSAIRMTLLKYTFV